MLYTFITTMVSAIYELCLALVLTEPNNRLLFLWNLCYSRIDLSSRDFCGRTQKLRKQEQREEGSGSTSLMRFYMQDEAHVISCRCVWLPKKTKKNVTPHRAVSEPRKRRKDIYASL